MSTPALHIPELDTQRGLVRLPPLRNVPLTSRIAEIVDHPAFQRLRLVRQLGPTHLVYPGAVHTRFEHSLGVYDMAGRYLTALLRRESIRAHLSSDDIFVCLLGALLHDIGHYPFAHSLEAVHLHGQDTPRHEDLAGPIIRGHIPALAGDRSIASIISSEFQVDPEEVIAMISNKPTTHASPSRRFVATIISSGVDADKADYLERDSIHMGVSYGRNYDRARFLDSLCANSDGDRLAVTAKGKVSSEIFVFCRYTMFSEGYWHHTVRSVSAMVERALLDYRLRERPDSDVLTKRLLSSSDDELLAGLARESPEGSPTRELLGSITHGRRSLYKRVLTLSRVYEDVRSRSAYERIYLLDAANRELLTRTLAAVLARFAGASVSSSELIIDTPPRDKDRIETVEVVYQVDGRARSYPLEDISKVVQGIATDFVKVVKKIRVFVHPRIRALIDEKNRSDELREVLVDAILGFEPRADAQLELGV